MPSRLGHGLYKKNDRLKNIFRCIYIINVAIQWQNIGALLGIAEPTYIKYNQS